MNDPKSSEHSRDHGNARAGGVFIVLGLLVGITLGIIYRQPSIGMVSGFVAGVAVAIVVWLFDRRAG